MINLGSRVKDSITGFQGIAFGRVDHLHGCAHIQIEPEYLDKDGKVVDVHGFDEQRVEVIEERVMKAIAAPVASYPLGSKVCDKLTGFKGIAICRSVDIYGNSHVLIQPSELREGNPIKSTYFHEHRVQLIEARVPTVSKQSSATSGSIADAPSVRR